MKIFWKNEELEWISQVFCEISDEFMNVTTVKISKIDRIFDELSCVIDCPASFFPDVSNSIKRTSNILKDDGYLLNYYVSHETNKKFIKLYETQYKFSIRIKKIEKKLNESNGITEVSDEMIKGDVEWFKQVFTRISDEIPNSVEEFEFIPFIVNNNIEVLRYEMRMCVPTKDAEFVKEELESIKEILELNKYKMEYNERYTAIHIRRFQQMGGNPGQLTNFKVTIERNGIEDVGRTIINKIDKKFNIKESVSNNSNLLIVDVQKSFHKFFTEIYVHKLKEYASQFGNVYQVWDNHIDGKNVDNDFLYHEEPKIPVHDDLYHFPNQKDIIEKRYNYKVDENFFKKILDRDIYKKIQNSKLKKGDYFPTKEGTIIVYIGNKHNFFHCPKKLYDLFKKLKGKGLSIVGGSDGECLEDIFTTAEALGVVATRDHRYIWSAAHCPIK